VPPHPSPPPRRGAGVERHRPQARRLATLPRAKNPGPTVRRAVAAATRAGRAKRTSRARPPAAQPPPSDPRRRSSTAGRSQFAALSRAKASLPTFFAVPLLRFGRVSGSGRKDCPLPSTVARTSQDSAAV
jgi:hypothetical protein